MYVARSLVADHCLMMSVSDLLLTPTFTNLIQIYAFSNCKRYSQPLSRHDLTGESTVHDITWGTRMVEQTEVNKDLGVAVSTGGAVNIDLPAGQSDIGIPS